MTRSDGDIYIPDGYRVELTDERIMAMGRRFLRFRAERFRRQHSARVPSYHLRIERVQGTPFLYEIVAYQNRLEEIGDSTQRAIHKADQYRRDQKGRLP